MKNWFSGEQSAENPLVLNHPWGWLDWTVCIRLRSSSSSLVFLLVMYEHAVAAVKAGALTVAGRSLRSNYSGRAPNEVDWGLCWHFSVGKIFRLMLLNLISFYEHWYKQTISMKMPFMKLFSVSKELKQLSNNSKLFAWARSFFKQHLSMQHEFQHLFRTQIFTYASLLKPKQKN